ncbi:hypothetical protein AGMMS50239_29970 [Bacteroidia bacterium]|nr:hypothetical protein AGMMS50239_29970 [Bacteroidia bacterium]
MKKLYVLFLLLIVVCCTNVRGQSGEWGYVLDLNPINTNNRHAKSSGSGTHLSIYPYDSNGNEGGMIYATESFRQERGEWHRVTVPMQINSINVKVPKVRIAHRVDWEGGGSNWAHNDLALFPSGYNQLEYNHFRACNGTHSTGCNFTQDLFNQMQGHVDVYTFPKNIKIVLQSSETQGISAENKAKAEAPAGYGSSVYRWVYRTSPTGTWQPIANTSLNGNRILEASLQDIYGSGFMNDGVVDFSSNTFIALEYDVYKSSSNVKDKEYSNIITLSNKLTAPKIVSATGGKTVCPGESNGKITVVVDRPLIAGKEIIEFFAWTSNGIKGNKRDYTRINDTTYEITGLIAGEYTVETGSRYGASEVSTNITDADHKRTGVKITEPDPVSYLVNEPDKKHISCKGGNDGSFKVTAGGGTGPYTLWWEADGASGFNPVANNLLEVSGLEAGTYRYYVTDVNNCELEDPQYGGILYKTLTLTEPAQSLAVSFLPDKTEMPTGNGRSDGYITAKISGGTPPYTVVWQEKTSNSVLLTVDNGIADESKLYDIPSGTYTVTVTDSKGCTLSTPAEFTLDEPDALKVTVTQQGQILCFGDASANLTVSVSGGAGGPYVYAWSKKINGIYTQISTNPYLNNQQAGDYKVWVSDGSTPPNEKEVEYSIQEPSELIVSATKIDVGCKDAGTGSVTLAITGGVAPYKIYYKESNASSYTSSTVNSAAYSITGLKAGTYDYYVTDANNCRANTGTGISGRVTVTEPAVAMEIISSEIKNISGSGRSDGSITVKVDGGIPYPAGNTYKITWRKDGGPVISSDTGTDGNGKFTSTVKDLDRGLYHLEIQDNNTVPCTISAVFNLTEPSPLSVSLAETNRIDCFGNHTARITASATGGIPRLSGSPYTYRWYRVEAGNDILTGNESNSTLNDIGAGVYKVKIEDGSTPPNTAESVIAVSQPSALETSVVGIKNISCFEGSDGYIHISVKGGSGGYKLYYKHNTQDTDYKLLPVTLPDNVFYLNNLPAGKYSLYIQDANGCTAQISGTDIAEFELLAPEKPLSVVSQQVIIPSGTGRNDGSIIITIDGGTPFDSGDKYLVSWKDENGNPLSPENALDAQGLFTGKISNLAKGEYFVEIRDKNYQNLDNGCYFATGITLKDPPPLIVSVENIQSVKCFGDNSGRLVAHAQGGIPYVAGLPYRYEWYRLADSGETLIAGANDSILSNIPAGSYKVKIADGSSETNYTESAVITLSQPEKLLTAVDTRMISCFRGGDGYIRISVTGGTGNYKLYYKLNGTDTDYRETGGGSQAHTFLLNNLPAGVYSVYIQDANSCYAAINGADMAEIVLSQPDKALGIATDTVYDPTSNGLSNGEIHIRPDGGTPEYTVIWRDSRGNELTARNSIVDGVFSSSLTGLGEGKYRVEVRDANYPKADQSNNTACIVIKEYELIQPEVFTLELEETHYISCHQMSDGEITAHAQGGVRNKEENRSPYQYTWYREEAGNFVVIPGRNDGILTGIPAGTYRLEVEDYARIPNRISAEYRIVQPEALTATSEDVRVVCGETATLSVAVSGGTMPYTYKWNTGDARPEVNDMAPGKYMVIVTDARGCEATAIAKITSPSDLSISADINHPVCYQAANGSIITRITGGTAPYTYRWSTGETTKDSRNIGAGVYTVVVTDKDGCSFSESFELKDPEPVKVDLGEDLTFCIGRYYLLAPRVEDPETAFSWTGPGGFQSKDPKVELSKAGTYRLTITDSKGCQATDEIEVFLTDYSISSEMVVATEMLANDTIVLVNISSPDPERIEWLFSENDPVVIVETSFEMAKIIFRQAGEYAVGMRSYLKECYQDVFKTLNVKEFDGSIGNNFGQTDILEFTVNPNPNDGNFKVKIELGRQSTVRLRLFSLTHGNLTDDKTLSGQKLYEESYRLFLAPGVYVLLLETASGRKSQKIIIH